MLPLPVDICSRGVSTIGLWHNRMDRTQLLLFTSDEILDISATVLEPSKSSTCKLFLPIKILFNPENWVLKNDCCLLTSEPPTDIRSIRMYIGHYNHIWNTF